MTVTLGEMMAQFRQALHDGGVEDAAAETRILVGGALGLDRAAMLTRSELVVGIDDEARLRAMLDRRLLGEPPHRILGRRGFFGLEFRLSEATLEPRPDTEILVEAVLERLRPRRGEPLSIVDLGTGTGAILLSLLSELPIARGVAVDLSTKALATAQENANALGMASRFEGCSGSWFEPLTGRVFDVIVSNPPYIPSSVIPALDVEVREHDPILALDGGEDGLDAYRAIAAGAGAHLARDGFVAVETGFDQRQTVEHIFRAQGFILLEARRDYGGNDRVQIFSKP
ncbi:release factor glutamine methyltransferase [Rhizobium sp. SG_E_25_P2]|uniref:peptide chain release factor N(5)-glutamine methyltransferase n=1 Tax=Rhizobium sp. SG_E_25_P2 TaxID=2879942 RepID=UPI002475365E|nr:peptide chain release factor N(5)-glutamine methyltransferase [Rhizobium sp. SG_E_25_P2]MDH6267667.1 release factor glutamine methyltransferase [Rhizobium sp. SG_E_25_P2]